MRRGRGAEGGRRSINAINNHTFEKAQETRAVLFFFSRITRHFSSQTRSDLSRYTRNWRCFCRFSDLYLPIPRHGLVVMERNAAKRVFATVSNNNGLFSACEMSVLNARLPPCTINFAIFRLFVACHVVRAT